jgi:hypothetical protein
MTTYNRDRDRDQENRDYRGEDDADSVLPVPLNNPSGGTYTPYVPFLPTNRPYEGLADEMAESNDNSRRGEHYGRGPAGYKRSDERID